MKRTFTDQVGNSIELGYLPRRIVSVVPSQTELLYDLGLRDEVVGITKFCVHPDEWFRSKTRVGGTKQLHIDKILSLQPDLIIANREENTEQQVNELLKHSPVWVSDIQTLDDAFAMMKQVGEMVGKEKESGILISDIINKLTTWVADNRGTAAYLIWKDPYMVAGGDTFINSMMNVAGFQNVFQGQLRYPSVTFEEINAQHPDYLLLSSEPFPFKEKHLAQMQLQFSQSKLLLVDGEMFSWYGSRMRLAADYFKTL